MVHETEYPVVARMQVCLQGWEQTGDRKAVFLSCYERMTCNMLAAIQAGDFEDQDWVSTLLQHFADYYFRALQSYEDQPEETPPVWSLAFEAARQPNTHVLQNLIMGVNAHINFDLVFALADLLEPEWPGLSPQSRQLRYRDHCRVNDIIGRTINAVQDQVIERYSAAMDVLDKALGPLDEWLISRLISAWREEVWQSATRLIEAPGEIERQALRQQVEQRSLQRGQAVAGEGGLFGLLELV